MNADAQRMIAKILNCDVTPEAVAQALATLDQQTAEAQERIRSGAAPGEDLAGRMAQEREADPVFAALGQLDQVRLLIDNGLA